MSKPITSASSSQTIATTLKLPSQGNPPKNRKGKNRKPRVNEAPPKEVTTQAQGALAAPNVRPSLALTQSGENWGAREEGETVEILTPKPIRRLPFNVKQFIVIHNACGASPSEVVKAVKNVFDLDLSPSNIEKLDPTKVSGQTMSMELKTLFRQMQREYQTMVVKAGIADQRWRLAKLHVIAQTAFDRGNYKLAMEAMEQAAKDAGGVYTNKTLVQVDDKRQLLAQLLRCDPTDLPAMKAAVEEAKEKEKVH